MQTDYTSQWLEENSNISEKQSAILEKLKIPLENRLSIFKSAHTLGLTKLGYDLCKNILEFHRLPFEDPIGARQKLILKNNSKYPYRITMDNKAIYTADRDIMVAYKLFLGEKQSFFLYFS